MSVIAAAIAATLLCRPDVATLRKIHANEVGLVPILEYHGIVSKECWLGRSRANFTKDLNRLYKEGYRPISLADYLSNRIDLPAGKSPVVLTFDDSIESQFCFRRDGTLDPGCAVAIMIKFHEAHKDFPLKATFFVLPKKAFQDPKTAKRKLKLLIKWGFEIGNHTLRHGWLNRMSDKQVENEIGGGAALLHQLVPEAAVETLAFPGGLAPRNRRLIKDGTYKGFQYHNRGGFLAAWEPAPAPVARGQNRMRIERILACEGPYGVTYWLDQMKSGAVKRYVCDGDPETTSVPLKLANGVDRQYLNGSKLILY